MHRCAKQREIHVHVWTGQSALSLGSDISGMRRFILFSNHRRHSPLYYQVSISVHSARDKKFMVFIGIPARAGAHVARDMKCFRLTSR